MLLSLLSIFSCVPWGCPRCHLAAGVSLRSALHTCSPVVLLIFCHALPTPPLSPPSFSYSSIASELCRDFFHLSLDSRCRELATEQSVAQKQLFKNRKAQTQHWLVMLASTLAFTDIKHKQLHRGEGCYTCWEIRACLYCWWALTPNPVSLPFGQYTSITDWRVGKGLREKRKEGIMIPDLCRRISKEEILLRGTFSV